MTKTYLFHINGLHCSSCVFLTESELTQVKGVTRAKTSLKQNQIEITGDFGEKTSGQIMNELAAVLNPHGYSLALEKEVRATQWSDFLIAIPVALVFIGIFLLLQRVGVVNWLHASTVTYGTAFLIGVIASVSTCMAMVGGIVLSLSATYAKEGERVRPQLLFQVGRLISFFVFGGLIGLLGSVFQLGTTGMLMLGLIVAFVLLVLGINLLDVFPWARNLQFTLPAGFGKKIHQFRNANQIVTPFVVGMLTFVLPCGFTQSMQIYTLSTGSFLKGGLTMFAFALGTLPVLSLLSFSSLALQKKAQSSVFFKTAGLIVLFFALFNLLNTLVAAGVIDPFFNF